jgi:hypothetical protein
MLLIFEFAVIGGGLQSCARVAIEEKQMTMRRGIIFPRICLILDSL